MNMNRWAFTIFSSAVLLFGTANAQQKYKLTVRQAAELALKNVTEIKNLQIDRELQMAKNKEYTAQAMPQVNGSVQSQHFFSKHFTYKHTTSTDSKHIALATSDCLRPYQPCNDVTQACSRQ